MHSLMMAQDILAAALVEAKKHNARQINAISVKIGDGHFEKSDSLQFCLEATAKCRECALVFPVESHLPICPHCGDRNPEIHHVHEPPQVTLELD